MKEVYVFDRKTQNVEKEEIYGLFFLKILYGNGMFPLILKNLLLPMTSRFAFFSYFYGFLQKKKSSRKKIFPFIKRFKVNTDEFELPIKKFSSFNDFFIRKLKKESRPIAEGEDIIVLPADGRYLFYPSIHKANGFYVKGEKFNLLTLTQNKTLYDTYRKGSLVIGRLCPMDYHRFHFPCQCLPSKAKLINGRFYSVNPLALRKKISIFSKNKRMMTELQTKMFGKILFIEVGATCVASIQQTYTPQTLCMKGEEKGYFQFGGSSILMFFPPKKVSFDKDLLISSSKRIEVKAHMGEQFGKAFTPIGPAFN